MPNYAVTVEYRAHQFFADEPQFYTAEDVAARDAEAAEGFACAQVRGLEHVTVSEIVGATATLLVEDTPAENLDKARGCLATLQVPFPPRGTT
jgi:hypothetical protein